MKLKVERKWKKDTYTIGILYVDGVRFSETLEDKDRGLSDRWMESAILKKKVWGETAIPTGTYEVQMSYSPKFANRAWAKKYNVNDITSNYISFHDNTQKGSYEVLVTNY